MDPPWWRYCMSKVRTCVQDYGTQTLPLILQVLALHSNPLTQDLAVFLAARASPFANFFCNFFSSLRLFLCAWLSCFATACSATSSASAIFRFFFFPSYRSVKNINMEEGVHDSQRFWSFLSWWPHFPRRFWILSV
jgi:hypothetical protein